MFCPHKNSYLQSIYSTVNPRLINRCLAEALEYGVIDAHDRSPGFQRLTSEQPSIPIGNIDYTRRPLAFDRWALPKLRRELHHGNPDVVLQAITSIGDLVHDPEKAYEAIRLRIPERMADLLENEKNTVRERVCLAYKILANLEVGRAAMVNNSKIMHSFMHLLEDQVASVRIKLAACLEEISAVWMSADSLVEYGFIPILIDRIQKEVPEIAIIHLKTLEHLMYGVGKDIGLKMGGFSILLNLIDNDNWLIRLYSLKCLMILTTTRQGKKMALEQNLLLPLTRLLYDEEIEVCAAAASCIMFCTILTKAKVSALEINSLPRRLVGLSKNQANLDLQMYCIRALSNLCENPKIRKIVQESHYQTIKDIPVGHSSDFARYKKALLDSLNWIPHSLG